MSFPESKLMFSKVLFCLTNSPKCKYIQFTMISNKEKQKIITLKKLKPENV